jgi:hypothetical protein
LLGKKQNENEINIENNIVYKKQNRINTDKINKIDKIFGEKIKNEKNFQEDEQEIEKIVENNQNISYISPEKIILNKLKQRTVSKYRDDTLININDFDKCKFWFSEILKYIVDDYDNYSNKKELIHTVWNSIVINTIISYYKKYYLSYGDNYNKENIISFCNNLSNNDFLTDIRIATNIYRMH